MMEEIREHRYVWYKFGCKDATYLDTKAKFAGLNFGEKILFTFHMLTCKYCRRFVAQVKKIESLLGAAREKGAKTLDPQRKLAINQLINDNLTKNQ